MSDIDTVDTEEWPEFYGGPFDGVRVGPDGTFDGKPHPQRMRPYGDIGFECWSKHFGSHFYQYVPETNRWFYGGPLQ